MDAKQLIISLRNKITKIPDNLQEKLNIKIIDDKQILINYKAKETEVGKILSILQKNDFIISDISTKQTDLEDIFKFLTKK